MNDCRLAFPGSVPETRAQGNLYSCFVKTSPDLERIGPASIIPVSYVHRILTAGILFFEHAERPT